MPLPSATNCTVKYHVDTSVATADQTDLVLKIAEFVAKISNHKKNIKKSYNNYNCYSEYS